MFKKDKPYRVTVLRQLGGVGDMVMTTPVFRGIKEKHPGCHLTVATTWVYASGALPQLLKMNPHIDAVVRIEPTEWAPAMLRRVKAEFSNVPNDWTPPCVEQADEVIELNVICSMVETATMPNVTKHRTDIWCDHAAVNPSSKKPVLILSNDELAQGKRWCDENLGEGTRVGVVLNAMSPVRAWPHAELFAADLQKAGFKALTLDPVKRCGEIPALIGKQIRFVASVIAHLDAVVTPDTGLLHIAGAVGTPILGLFGSTDPMMRMREYAGSFSLPKRIVPCGCCFYVYGCLKDKDPANHIVCMKQLTRKLVMCELEKLLERYGKV
jgi:glycosyl transferase family 9 (putative heptosyltransferase)